LPGDESLHDSFTHDSIDAETLPVCVFRQDHDPPQVVARDETFGERLNQS